MRVPEQLKKYIPTFLLFFLFGAGIFLGNQIINNQSFDTRSRATGTDVTLSLSAPITVSPDEQFSLGILVNLPSAHDVVAADVTLTYPSALLAVESVTPGQFFMDYYATNTQMLNIIQTNTPGVVRIILGSPCVDTTVVTDPTLWRCFTRSTSAILASIRFRVLSQISAVATIGFNSQMTMAAGANETTNIIDQTQLAPVSVQIQSTQPTLTPTPTIDIVPTRPGATETPTPPPGCHYEQVECIQAPCDPILVCVSPSVTPTNTPTPTDTPMPTITPIPTNTPTPQPTPTPLPTPTPGLVNVLLRLRFQGVANQKTAETKVVFMQNATEVFRDNQLTTASDTTGVFTAQIPNIPPGTYDVFVKGWAHLQKKFTVTITDVGGNAIVDLTGSRMNGGDVNHDGVVNLLDIGRIINYYGTTPPPNTVADVNLDNIADILDIGMMITNYELRDEQ